MQNKAMPMQILQQNPSSTYPKLRDFFHGFLPQSVYDRKEDLIGRYLTMMYPETADIKSRFCLTRK